MKPRHANSPEFPYFRAFSRNIGIFSEDEQARLRNIKVAIPGCGGVGGLHAITLARIGFGHFVLADFDVFEVENMNRQFGAKATTLGRAKTETIRREILDINPTAEVRTFDNGIDSGNVHQFLDGVDVVVDALDYFAFAARDALFPAARNLGIPVITGAPFGFSCALLVFTKASMTYEDYFAFLPDDSFETRALKVAVGMAPAGIHFSYMNPSNIDLASRKGPSSAIAVDLCGGMVAAEAIKLVLGRGRVRAAPRYIQFDPYLLKLRKGCMYFGNRNPIQRLRLRAARLFLAKKHKP